MYQHCIRHFEEPAGAICKSCRRPFCERCLVYSFGPKKPPFCVGCALTAAGVRAGRIVTTGGRPPSELDGEDRRARPDRRLARAERRAARATERSVARSASSTDAVATGTAGPGLPTSAPGEVAFPAAAELVPPPSELIRSY